MLRVRTASLWTMVGRLWLVVAVALSAAGAIPVPRADAATAQVDLGVTVVSESFEGAFPPAGWTATGHWGQSSCAHSAGSFSAWAEGAGGLACSSVYHGSESGLLKYGPFDLGDATAATLSFDLQLWSAQGDTFEWLASADGVNFFGQTLGETFPPVWGAHTLDLAAVPGLGDLRGDASVWIAFRWQTDGFAEAFDGAYVDNVVVTKTIAPAAQLFLPVVRKPCPAPGGLFHSTLALDAASSGYATAPDSETLDLADADGEDFTLETFFYVADLSNTTTDTLFQKSGTYWMYVLFSASAADRFIYRLWITAVDYVYLDYDVSLTVGWHHVAFVFDNEYTDSQDRMAIYLDGSLVKSATNVEWTPGLRNTAAAATLGGSFTGRLEETRVSDSVRYGSGTYPVPAAPFAVDANTRALWHFDEAAGAVSLADASGNGNSLTGVNGAHTETCSSP